MFSDSRNPCARTTHDAVFALQPFSYIDRVVLRSGYYESEMLAALRPHLGPGAVLWDIGANFGLHSITAKLLSPETTVVCFEPAPAIHTRLAHHARLNRLEVLLSPFFFRPLEFRRFFHALSRCGRKFRHDHPLAVVWRHLHRHCDGHDRAR